MPGTAASSRLRGRSLRSWLRAAALATLALLAIAALPAGATTFTVKNTADSGTDSLRAALLAAQTCAGGPHTIDFDIPVELLTGGVAVITPSSSLPSITCAGTTLDATTQTSNRGNTNDVTLGTGGTVGTGADGRAGSGDEPSLSQLNGPEVEIVGSGLGGPILTVNADDVTIRGLSLHGGGNFGSNGTGSGNIHIQGGTHVLVEKNVVGASATSYTLPAAQTQDNLVLVTGGTTIDILDNLMGFARWRSVLVFSPAGTVTIQGNEVAGSSDGVDLSSPGTGPTGTITINRNLFRDTVDNSSGSNEFAFFVTQTGMTGSTSITNNTVRNVDVGLISDAARPVLFQHNIVTGGVNDAIVHISGPEAVTIDANAISDNLLGIDINPNGVTPNDGLKSAGSLNDGMDYPIITAVSVAGGMLSIEGYVGSNPLGSATFASSVIQLFKADNDPANQRGEIVLGDGAMASHGEGAIYLGSLTTDNMGRFLTNSMAVPGGVTLLAGDPITATATDTAGNTSEFGPDAYLPIVLDVDANGSTGALTDALLVLRHFFGFTGTTLSGGAVGGGCARCTAAAITSHLVELDLALDIDGNGTLGALTDGLLILRYLFGFTGPTLVDGAIGGGCTRCDSSSIEAYLSTIHSP